MGSRLGASRFTQMACIVAITLATPELGAAQEVTEFELGPGLWYRHEVATGPLQIHAVFVDLCDASLSIRATRSDERSQRTNAWAEAVDAEVAINGDFFSFSDYSTRGLSMGNGEPWTDTDDDELEGMLASGPDGRVEIRLGDEVLAEPETWMEQIVSGRPNCLIDGLPQHDTARHFDDRHPRTAVGLTEDLRTLILLVVDGRSSNSIGVTTEKVGQILEGLGAYHGLNLDGGGSSTLFAQEHGVLNDPSDGSVRRVANHLGIVRDESQFGLSRCEPPEPNDAGVDPDENDAGIAPPGRDGGQFSSNQDAGVPRTSPDAGVPRREPIEVSGCTSAGPIGTADLWTLTLLIAVATTRNRWRRTMP